MKRMKKLEIYDRPTIVVELIKVERGFAGSFESGWDDRVDPYEPVTPPGGEDLFPEED